MKVFMTYQGSLNNFWFYFITVTLKQPNFKYYYIMQK